MTAITYKQLREDASIRTYIIRADESLLALGFTEHSFAHVTMVSENAAHILETLGYSEHEVKEVGKLVAEMKYGKGKIPKLSEEQVADLMVGETDYMVGLLMQALKDNNLYDNTVIVAYADHYLYTINDKSVLDKYKETDNNLINRTPFFIWSSDMKAEKIDRTNMQMNILPTVLNLFGIDYNSNYYIGKDILSNDYSPLAFFADSSWYDGNAYKLGNHLLKKTDIFPSTSVITISRLRFTTPFTIIWAHLSALIILSSARVLAVRILRREKRNFWML